MAGERGIGAREGAGLKGQRYGEAGSEEEAEEEEEEEEEECRRGRQGLACLQDASATKAASRRGRCQSSGRDWGGRIGV